MSNDIAIRPTFWQTIIATIICVIITLGVGVLSAAMSPDMQSFYSNLKLPAFSPPGKLFPIVWTILYVLMGISVARVFLLAQGITKLPLILLFIFQLLLNFGWSFVFFGKQAYVFSSVWIVVLWLAVLANIIMFANVSKLASILLIPYLCWVTFATYLTIGVALLN